MSIGIVKTEYGLAAGEEYTGDFEGITVFRGIPYAKAPVGDLRFREPVNPEPWDGVREFTKFGPPAIQTPLSDRHAREYYFDGFPEMNEDCLYLNICTGAKSKAERRPVYIWFHGGGLTNCWSGEVQFNPQILAKKGIVVVTVGQRLNLFGYLQLPQLDTEQKGHGGNYGFKDQLKALDWITNNISVFGGDPENMTAGGQSGGALKAWMLAYSPAGKGRIRRVISQSGLKWQIRLKSKEQAYEIGKHYLKLAGLPENITPEELRKIPADRLFLKNAARADMPGDMIQEEGIIPGSTCDECLRNNPVKVDFLNVTNLGEAELFGYSKAGMNPDYHPEMKHKGMNAQEFYAHFKNLLGNRYEETHFEELFPVTDENAWKTAELIASMGICGSEGMNVSRNLMLNCMFGNYLDKHIPGCRVYNALWAYMLPLEGEDMGSDRDCKAALAWHSTDLWFSFASLRKGTPPDRPWRDQDFNMADILSSYWANFIRTGNPNECDLPEWPAANRNYAYMILDESLKCRRGLDEPIAKLVHEFVCAEYQLSEL